MKFEYFPQEIAAALIDIAHVDDEPTEGNKTMYENTISALYDLKAICENRYNADYYRDFYKLLERVTEEYNRK